MSLIILRVVVAALVAAMLAVRSRQASGPQRRRAFSLGAVAFGLISLSNLLGLLGVGGWPAYLVTLGGVAVMLASLVTLVFAYRAGEFAGHMDRARAIVGEERRKQDEAARAREPRS